MPKDTVKLGLMPPLTGLVGIYGTEIARAAQIACQEINENGGVLGRQLELVIEDDSSLPDSAVIAAEKLVDQHRCVAIIGNLLSNSRIAVAYRVAEPRKIPYLNFSFYEGSILSRYFFHFAALPNQQIDRMIPYMRQKYGPRMFFAGNNYEWPRGSIDAAKRSLLRAGGTVVGEEYCPIGTPLADIEHLLDQVEQAAPDVFVPYFAGADQVNLLTRFTERGLKPRMAVVMGHYDEMMASILPPGVREGFFSSNSYFMTVDSDESRNYLQRLASLPGVNGIWPNGNGILTNFGEGTYLCVKAFAQAANAAGSLDPEALVDVLKTISVSGPQGKVSMDPATHHARVNTYLSRCQNNGEFAIIERFGAIEPQLPERYNHQRISHQATLEDDIRLQARMLEQMSEAVFLVNASNGTIVYANAGADRMMGYDKGEQIGKPMSLLAATSDSNEKNAPAGIIGQLEQKGSWQGEISYTRKDGSNIWCSVTASTFTHPVFGEVWLCVAGEITARKLAEEALRHLNLELEQRVTERTLEMKAALEEAERANFAKSEFLSHMSHELRTPLNAILGFGQLLEIDNNPKLSVLQTGNVHEILDAGKHLLELINEVLDLARIESGRLELSLEPVDVLPLIKTCVSQLQPLAAQHNIRFMLDLSTPHTVQGDLLRLREILINLLSNAVKYNREGGSIEITCTPAAERRLRISVRDTGQGIAAESLPRLFKPFERMEGSHNGIEGTGIGLALAKKLVEIMHGVIGVDSVKGQGCTFWFELPLAAAGKASSSSAAHNTAFSANGRRRRILYIEDNPANLRLVHKIVNSRKDIELLDAENAEDGLEIATAQRPELILLDINLPGMDGYEALRKLRSNILTRNIPVIAVSANAMPSDIARGMAAEFNEYLTKPLDVARFLKTLERYLPLH